LRTAAAEKVKEFDATVWVDLYGDYLFARAFARVREPQAAEDLVRQTLLAAARARDSFAGKSSEKAWLGGILKDKIIDFFRCRWREPDFSPDETDMSAYQYLFADETWKDHWTAETMPGEWQITPEQALERSEFCAVLENCLGELPARVANCFTLREMDGCEAAEICEILQVSTDIYREMLHRARTHLRRCLEYDWFRKAIIQESSCLEK
jgi:RNA polymerase sigma-70 factor (TIGR02943 family)